MNNDRYTLSLFIAIGVEIVATTLLALSKGMTVLLPAIMALICYAISYYFLARSLKKIPLGLAYAIWAGVGIVATSIINQFLFDIRLSIGSVIGITMIVSGVLVIRLLSKESSCEASAEKK